MVNKKLLLVVLLLVLLVAGWQCKRLARTPSRWPGLIFLGQPMASAGGVLAFNVTNSSPREISYLVCALQVKSNGVWPEVRVTAGAMTPLKARQAGTLLVTPPSGSGVWRVPVTWCYHPTERQFWQNRVTNFFRNLTGALPVGFALEAHTNYSEEMKIKGNE